MLPACERPEHTELYEGFYHLCAMSGNVEKAELHYIVRDHDNAAFEAKKKTLALIAKTLNEKYGEGTVALTITDQYQNMAEKIKPCMHLIENAQACGSLAMSRRLHRFEAARTVHVCPMMVCRVRILAPADMHSTAHLSISRQRAWMWQCRLHLELLRSMQRNKRRISEYKIFEVQNLCY